MSEPEPRWPMFLRVWRRATLIDRVIDKLGLDLVAAVRLDKGDAYREACANCQTCSVVRACRHLLDSVEPTSVSLGNCPNLQYYERCGRSSRSTG